VARTTRLATVLWISTAVWLAGCGRLWFDGVNDGADPPADGPEVDVPAPDAPDDIAVASAPRLDVAPKLTMSTECGGATPLSSLVVMNSGTADLTIDNASLTGDPFQVKAVPLIIAPGASGTFKIEPPMAVVGTDRGGDVKRGTLKIESNAGVAMVDLEATVIGANLVMTAPVPINFTSSSGACPASKQFSIQNTGNVTVTVVPDVASPFAFAFSSSSDTVLAAGESLFINVRPVTSSSCAGSGAVGFTAASGTVCTDGPPFHVTFNIQGSSTCQCS
jgi:hypothetical protein